MLFQALSILTPGGSLIRSGRQTIALRHTAPPELPLRDLIIVQHDAPIDEENQEDPAGRIVAMVDIIAADPWEEIDLAAAGRSEFVPGWLAWKMTNIRRAAYNRTVPAQLSVYVLDLNPKYLLHPEGSLGEQLKDTATEAKQKRAAESESLPIL